VGEVSIELCSSERISDPLKALKVEFEDEEEDEDELQFVFPPSPQLLKEGLCCSERRPLFRGVAREKA
jgi:hypothetical protein